MARQTEIRLSSRGRKHGELEPESAAIRANGDRLRAQLEQRRELHVREALRIARPHLERTLGPRPDEPGRRGAWDRAAIAIERYRFDYQVRGPSPLGSQPIEREARLAHRRAQREIERANRRLGRELARAHGREL